MNIGEIITVDGKWRKIKNIINNVKNQPVVVWESKHREGACIPQIWKTWKKTKKDDFEKIKWL